VALLGLRWWTTGIGPRFAQQPAKVKAAPRWPVVFVSGGIGLA